MLHYDFDGTTKTVTCDAEVGCKGEDFLIDPGEPLGLYSLSITSTGIDSSGQAVAFDFEYAGQSETSPLRLFAVWYSALDRTALCATEYAVVSSKLLGGPFDFVTRESNGDPGAFSTSAWNAWKWSLTEVTNDCEGELDTAGLATIGSVLPSDLYVAVAPGVGDLADFAVDDLGVPADSVGLFGVFEDENGNYEDPTSATASGQFVEQRAFHAYAWDGSSVLDADNLVDRGGLDTLATGDHALTDAVLVDVWGWYLVP